MWMPSFRVRSNASRKFVPCISDYCHFIQHYRMPVAKRQLQMEKKKSRELTTSDERRPNVKLNRDQAERWIMDNTFFKGLLRYSDETACMLTFSFLLTLYRVATHATLYKKWSVSCNVTIWSRTRIQMFHLHKQCQGIRMMILRLIVTQ